MGAEGLDLVRVSRFAYYFRVENPASSFCYRIAREHSGDSLNETRRCSERVSKGWREVGKTSSGSSRYYKALRVDGMEPEFPGLVPELTKAYDDMKIYCALAIVYVFVIAVWVWGVGYSSGLGDNRLFDFFQVVAPLLSAVGIFSAALFFRNFQLWGFLSK